MRRSVPTLSLLLGLACVFDSPEESTPLAIAGTWRFTEELADPLRGVACTDTGLYELTQVRDSFVGTYQQSGVCTTPQGPFANRQRGTVTGGRIVGNTIQFHVPSDCDYDGRLTGSPPTLVSGKGYCVVHDVDGSVAFNYVGPWQANR